MYICLKNYRRKLWICQKKKNRGRNYIGTSEWANSVILESLVGKNTLERWWWCGVETVVVFAECSQVRGHRLRSINSGRRSTIIGNVVVFHSIFSCFAGEKTRWTSSGFCDATRRCFSLTVRAWLVGRSVVVGVQRHAVDENRGWYLNLEQFTTESEFDLLIIGPSK